MIQAFLALIVASLLAIGGQQWYIRYLHGKIDKMKAESAQNEIQAFRRQEAIETRVLDAQKRTAAANKAAQDALAKKTETVINEIQFVPVAADCELPDRMREAIDDVRRDAARSIDAGYKVE